MRYWLVIWMIIGCSVFSDLNAQNDVSYFRALFQKAQNKSDFEKIVNSEVQEQDNMNLIIIDSYKAVSKATLARYTFNPYFKLKYFDQGTGDLDGLILKKKCVDNVFLRLIIQLNVPDFLNYNDDIKSDLTYFLDHIETADLSLKMKQFMIQTVLKVKNEDASLTNLFTSLENTIEVLN